MWRRKCEAGKVRLENMLYVIGKFYTVLQVFQC